MRRILHVLGALNRGGAETMVMNLYRAIDKSKIQFDFIVHTDEKCDYSDEILQMGGRIYSVPRYQGTNHFAYVHAWKKFFSHHPEYKILHSHVRSTAAIYLPIAKKNGLKTIVHSHSTSNGKGVSSKVKALLQYPLRYQADFYMGCSKASGEWLFGNKICKSNKFAVIPNAIDVDKHRLDGAVREEYRSRFDVTDQYVYIHVGRFHEAKNHDFLLELYHEVIQQKPNTVLWLVGDGDLRQQIEKKIQDLGLEENVRLLGSRNDVPQLLQAADMFLFPSKWEGLPLTVVEAQAAGLKCVISDAITTEVDITDLIKRCSLDDNINVWIESILSHNALDKDSGDKVKKAGFDIKSSCKELINIYDILEAS